MTVKTILKSFDSLDKKKFDELHVYSTLATYFSENKNVTDFESTSDLLAFQLVEDSKDKRVKWETYYGPAIIWDNEDGTTGMFPSFTSITTEVIDYWTKRAKDCVNPILIAKYSGLVWDFQNKVTGIKPSHEICHLNINSLLLIAKEDYLKHEAYTFSKLERALNLSMMLRDKNLVSESIEGIINYARRKGKERKSLAWEAIFDISIKNKNTLFSDTERNEIIKGLEEKLSSLAQESQTGNKVEPRHIQDVAERLASYYKEQSKTADVKRVLNEVKKVVSNNMPDESGLKESIWLHELHNLFLKFNLKEEAREIASEILNHGAKLLSGLKEVKHTIKFPMDEFEKYIASMTSGSFHDVLARVTITFIPNLKKIIKEVKESPSIFTLTSQIIIGDAGRVVAQLDPEKENLDGKIIQNITLGLPIKSTLIREIMNASITNGLTKIDILDFLKKTAVIKKERFTIVEKGLDAYFANDHLVAIHLLIPQIEDGIRNTMNLSNGNITKAKHGILNLRTLDDLLRDKELVNILGENITYYFRTLFTDARGWNLRNEVCHGMAELDLFNEQASDLVLHALLCLGIIVYKEEVQNGTKI